MTKSDKVEWSEKCHYTSSSDILFEWRECLICYFIFMLFYIKRKWLLMRNLATILLLISKFSGKFQRFTAIDRSVEILIDLSIYQLPPQLILHQIKSYYVSGTKIFLRRYTEIYRHLLSKCFKNMMLERQKMAQYKCCFRRQTETFFLENL